MDKNVILVAGSEKTKEALVRQVAEYVPREVRIRGIATETGIKEPVSGPLVVFSSDEVYTELLDMGMCGDIDKYIICNRTLDFDRIEELVALPTKTRALFVNDTEHTTHACMDDLRELGINHVTFFPYYPGMQRNAENETIELAVTAGEVDKVPTHVKKLIDMGVRVIDIISLYKIIGALGIENFDVNRNLRKYLKKIVNVSQKVAVHAAEIDSLRRNLKHEMIVKGYQAQYNFADMIGESEEIKKAKDKAMKLAGTELTILIEGESGTGKELFASAIHNASSRKDKAFVAINFSALPEELVESELFGYEEGAFTGARRGGKRGIFEMAEGGTLFLDEIGDISPRVQTRLLRVLQEKEIMPIGSLIIKKVDIRMIAATNQNLAELVENKKFRADLYYRLKIGHLIIPPLRRRKSDIKKLACFFIEQEKGGNEITIDPQAMRILEGGDWYGNVRELRATIQYMMAVRRGKTLDIEDFPEIGGAQEGELISDLLSETHLAIIEAIRSLKQKGMATGRDSIARELAERDIRLTPAQVRIRLLDMVQNGYIQNGKGRQGVCLSETGRKLMQEMREHTKRQ